MLFLCCIVQDKEGRVAGNGNGTVYAFADVELAAYVLKNKGRKEGTDFFVLPMAEAKRIFGKKDYKNLKLFEDVCGQIISKNFPLSDDERVK